VKKNFCQHFGKCGGCAYLDLPYEEELAIKRNALIETLGEYAKFFGALHVVPEKNFAREECVFFPREGYRNKMEFAFGDDGKDGNLALGIRKKRSFYEVASPENCVLICDDFKKIVAFVTEFFRDAGEKFFHRKRHTGALRHLVLRRGENTGEILVLLSAASSLGASLENFSDGLLKLPLAGKIVGVLHSENDGLADAVKNEKIKILRGRDFFFEEICGLRFKISAFSFFQTNSRGAEILFAFVRDFAGANGTALDLYCGTGTIAQVVAPNFERVVGVEIVEEAIFAARENAAINGIANCEFFAGDAFEVLQKIFFASGERVGFCENSMCGCDENTTESSRFSRINAVIVDPPRDGLHPKALEKIAALGAPRIVYVACKPKSLVRDLPFLLRAGYEVQKIEAVDMFPRTPHIELVTVLYSTSP